MKNIVFYAPPAAGKGTQCNMLADNFGYKTLSIGQVLRNARNPETEVGRIIIETQDKGILTPDNIVAEALSEEIKKYAGSPIILDGYPRNINQAKVLDNYLDNYIVININIERQIAFERITGRRSCEKCNKIYNIYTPGMIPKEEGKCDICGEPFIIRDDDNEQAFNVRFDIYEQNAPEIKAFYQEKGLLREVEAKNDKNEVFAQIKDILSKEE